MLHKEGRKVISPEVAKAVREGGELRQDLITGKWVIVAPGRAKRPHKANANGGKKAPVKYQDNCPFCNLAAFPQSPDILRLPDNERWNFHVFENKYPALKPASEYSVWNTGPYRALQAVGYHELLAPRWHNQDEWRLTLPELALELEVLVRRYRQLRTQFSVNYIQIIRNHGPESGASLEHPHHQIFAIPVLPSEVLDMMQGAERWHNAHGSDVFAELVNFELSDRQRLVTENESFVAWCPYASRMNYEIWIMPRKPQPFFEDIGPKERERLAEMLRDILRRMQAVLSDPPFNYVIYSAPCDYTGTVATPEMARRFRWHMVILPRLRTWGGFELGTGLEITDVRPEEAALALREADLDGLE